MAEILENYTFPAPRARQTYPWDEWLDGKTRRLRSGVDYFSKTTSFRVQALSAAKSRGKQARLTTGSDAQGEYVVVQAIARVEEEW